MGLGMRLKQAAQIGAASPAKAVDPAVRVLVRRDSQLRPASALDWAHRLHNHTLRQRVLTAVGRAWLERAPAEFKAWLPDSGLEKQIQELILNAQPRRGRPDGASPGASFDGSISEGM